MADIRSRRQMMISLCSRTIPGALLLCVAVATSAPGQEPPSLSAPASACANLKGLRLPDVRFSEIVDAPDSLDHGDNVRAPHCRVSGTIGKATAFTVMLPNRWNQRLLMGGNGGYAGTINRGILANATQGYVTVSTNTGHVATAGGGARWALNDVEAQLDWGYVAVHRTVEVAKVLAKAFYGSEPRYSYFNGCSNGGRQGLMEVQRYPEDFDGVISGAPAAHFSEIGASFLKNIQAAFPTRAHFNAPIVTSANLALLGAKVLEMCDTLDGVKDGVLDDPRDCKFGLSALRACSGNKPGADCLTTSQRTALARIYSPARDDRGNVIYPGQPFGGENLAGGWSDWIVGRDSALMHELGVPSAQAMFVVEGARYITFGDSTWDYSTYRGSLYKEFRRSEHMFDADNPDIARFGARKGKLILWHGWADPALNALATIDYYEKVLATDPQARDYVRLFLAPGVLHCGGGNGPGSVPWLATMVAWVERDQAPERVTATKRDSAQKVVRTRPLCSYPKRAVYTGQGSTDDANNFVCREP
jgi:hypothetical protein